MISRILFGISDIIIHGSKWCENVVVCRRRCWGRPQMIISHKCPSRLRSWGGKCNKILLKNNIYSAPVRRRPPCGDNNTQIKTTNCSLSVYRIVACVTMLYKQRRVLVSSCLMLDYWAVVGECQLSKHQCHAVTVQHVACSRVNTGDSTE